MAMQSSSVSQGIFFEGPKKKSKSTNKLNVNDATLKYFDGFGQPGKTAEIRSKLYKHLLLQKKENILKLQERWFEDFVTDVVTYIRMSKDSVVSDNQEATTPIAFLATGLPQDENKMLLDKIFEHVQHFTPHVITLSSQTSGNVKNAFQIMSKQLIDKCYDSISNDSQLSESEDILNVTSQNTSSRLKFVSAHDLQNWYERGSYQKPIVIFIEDIDFFPLPVAQNLLMAFSCLKLPVMFVVGVTSCCENFDYYVPQRCPTTFLYKTFHPVSPSDRLADFMHGIILDVNSIFQLSGPVVQYLLNIFRHHEFSCTKLEQILQLCLLEHFRTPESVFCSDYIHLLEEFVNSELCIQDVANETFEGESSAKLKTSLKMKISKASPRKITQQTVSEPMIDDVESHINTFQKRKSEWYGYLQFFNAIIQNVPGSPFECNIVDLYVLCWNGDIFKNRMGNEDQRSPFDTICGLFNIMSRSQLESQLKRGFNKLKSFHVTYDSKETDSRQLLTELESFLQEFQDVEKKDRKLAEERKREEEKPQVIVLQKLRTHTQWKETLRAKINSSTDSAYTSLRGKIVEWLKVQTTKFLRPLQKLPYNKAFIFHDIEFIREVLTASLQKRIHVALVDPSKFLNANETTTVGIDEENKSDISILYNLLLEQQMQNISLNILYQSFKSFIEVEPSPRKRQSVATKKKHGSPPLDQIYLIRFRQAVAELQHMGFLKRSKAKVDEVARQTFGF